MRARTVSVMSTRRPQDAHTRRRIGTRLAAVTLAVVTALVGLPLPVANPGQTGGNGTNGFGFAPTANEARGTSRLPWIAGSPALTQGPGAATILGSGTQTLNGGSGTLEYTYDWSACTGARVPGSCASDTGMGFSETQSMTVDQAQWYKLDFTWTGDHGGANSIAQLELNLGFPNGSGGYDWGQWIYRRYGPAGIATPLDGPFNIADSSTFQVPAGAILQVVIKGSTADADAFLSGTLDVTIHGTADQGDLSQPNGAGHEVNSFDDHDDGVCGLVDCTLREAILAVNAQGSIGAQTSITFRANDYDPHTIALQQALPVITKPVDMDTLGSMDVTCPGWPPGGLGMRLTIKPADGLGDTIPNGLVFAAAGVYSRVRGIVMGGFSGAAITVGELGSPTSALADPWYGLSIQCMVLGTPDLPNGIGVDLNDVSYGMVGNSELAGLCCDFSTVSLNVIGYSATAGIRLRTTGPQLGGIVLTGNLFRANQGPAIDLGGDGPTPNDAGDADQGANDLLNAPVLTRAQSGSPGVIAGTLDVPMGDAYEVTLYLVDACDAQGNTGTDRIIGVAHVTPAPGGATFSVAINGLPATGGVVAAAMSPTRATSELSNCLPMGGNDGWSNAIALGESAMVKGRLTATGQARWYRVPVSPGAQVHAELTGLPADYDLLLFRDIAQAEAAAAADSTTDLAQLSAELGATGTKAAPTGQRFSPTGQRFSDTTFSPTGQRFSPTGQRFSGDLGFTPDPVALDPGQKFAGPTLTATGAHVYSPSPGTVIPGPAADSWSSAVARSLVDFSTGAGLVDEQLTDNTWSDTGWYYLRVGGHNGVFDAGADFTLSVTVTGGVCTGLDPRTGVALNVPAATGRKTVILWDSSRITGTAAERTTLATRLATFAARSEVAGVVVDLASVTRVAQLNAQADDPVHSSCAYAKNLVADAAKAVVDAYRTPSNPALAYVVLVGGDAVVPFFRHADTAELAPESGYVPPVLPLSPSEASLRTANVLSQDDYGAARSLTLGAVSLPVPDLAVGRLVESAADATAMLDAYLTTAGGVVATPTRSLVTGYDFMADAADAVEADLVAGMGTGAGQVHDTLVDAATVPPADGWTADQLRTALLGSRHDIVFLAGHFSASETLAADYATSMTTAELAAAGATSFTNTIVFSQGCHSGYSLVDADAVPSVTEPLDWAETFNARGASLVAGTGYQYGDTDLVAYSEAIYAGFAHQLRLGAGPVAIGRALGGAKRAYLAANPSLSGVDAKALLEATLFGLPMLSVDLPSGRLPAVSDAPTITPVAVVGGAGGALDLKVHDTTVDTTARTIHTKSLAVDGGGDVTATWWSGPDGIAARPYQPALPLNTDGAGAADLMLRGVGFRGGAYSDLAGSIPLSGAVTTEAATAHTGFGSPVFHPERVAGVSYTDALAGGQPKLVLTPIQYQSEGAASLTATARRFNSVDLRLYYSATTGAAALAGPPSLSAVTVTDDGAGGVDISLRASADPAAGLADVWVVYTGWSARWDALDLVADGMDATLYTGHLVVPDGHTAAQLRLIAQAATGTGVVAWDANDGAYWSVVPAAGGVPAATTTLVLDPANPAAATFGTSITVGATLSGASPASGQVVLLSAAGSSLAGVTDAFGHVSVTLPVTAPAGSSSVSASFAGDAANLPSSAAGALTVVKAAPTLVIGGLTSGHPGTPNEITATLTDALGAPMPQRAIAFTVANPQTPDVAQTRVVTTNRLGIAALGPITVTGGSYTVRAVFGDQVAILPTGGTLDMTDPGFAAAEDSLAYEVIVQTGTLSFSLAGLPAKRYGDAAFPVASYAETNSTGPVVFSAAPQSAGCAVAADGLVTLTGSGTCIVRASLPASGDFSAAGPIDQSFAVATRAATLANTSAAVVSAGTRTSAAVTLTGTIRTAAGSSAVLAGSHLEFRLFRPTSSSATPDATCAADANAAGVVSCSRTLAAGPWLVYLVLAGSETRWTAAPADPVVVTVTRTVAKSVAGGGWVVDPSTRNVPVRVAPAPRNKGRFGALALLGASKSGSLVYTFHGTDGLDWVFATTSWAGARVSLSASKLTVTAACTVSARRPSTLARVAGKGGTGYTCTWVLVGGTAPKLSLTVKKGATLVHQVGTASLPIRLGALGSIRIRT